MRYYWYGAYDSIASLATHFDQWNFNIPLEKTVPAANRTWLWRFTACDFGHAKKMQWQRAPQAKAHCDPGTGCCFAWRPLQRHRKIKANQHGLHFGQVTSKSFQPVSRRQFLKWTFQLVFLLLEKAPLRGHFPTYIFLLFPGRPQKCFSWLKTLIA